MKITHCQVQFLETTETRDAGFVSAKMTWLLLYEKETDAASLLRIEEQKIIDAFEGTHLDWDGTGPIPLDAVYTPERAARVGYILGYSIHEPAPCVLSIDMRLDVDRDISDATALIAITRNVLQRLLDTGLWPEADRG